MEIIHGGDIYRNQVMLDFSVNINPLGTPEDVKKALRNAVDDCQKYPDPLAEELKKSVAKMLSVEEEWLLFGNGASELLMGIFHEMSPKKVLIPIPSFYGYQYAAETTADQILYYTLREETDFLPGEDLLDLLAEESADFLILGNPNNPTGKTLPKDVLMRILDFCEDRGIKVVLDECFIEFCQKDRSALPLLNRYKNLGILRAFTKSFAIPGVRLGYLVSGNRLWLERIQKNLPEWNVSVFAQAAGISCTKQMEYLERSRNLLVQERLYLRQELTRMGIRVVEGEADFLLLFSERPLYEMLLKKGILIRDCKNFKGLEKGCYRIAVKERKENERLLKAIGECIE